jgi:2'-5' RNA ligase
MAERLYSIEVPILERDSTYLRNITTKSVNTGECFVQNNHHLTINKSFYCSDRNIRINLENWLKTQEPFSFRLDGVAHFIHQNGGLIYLTSTDQDQRERTEDLHYQIHKLIRSDNPKKQNNYKYIPHVTLVREISPVEIGYTQEKIKRENLTPIVMEIFGIKIRVKEENGWNDAKFFRLGGETIREEDFI